MELVGLTVALALAFLIGRRRRPNAPAPVALDLHPDDVAELRRTAHLLLWEHLTTRSAALARLVRALLQRGVPASGIVQHPGGGWVLTFADGSGLQVAARRPGDLLALVVGLSHGSVPLVGHTFDGDDVALDLDAGRRRVRVVALAPA